MYYAAVALFKPAAMSLSTIASLQQSAVLLRWLFWDIFDQADVLRQNITRVQQLYDLEKTVQVINDGDIPYPSDKESEKGMALELRYVPLRPVVGVLVIMM